MAAHHQAPQGSLAYPAKDAVAFNPLQTRSSSGKSSVGITAETGEETTSLDHGRKRQRLQQPVPGLVRDDSAHSNADFAQELGNLDVAESRNFHGEGNTMAERSGKSDVRLERRRLGTDTNAVVDSRSLDNDVLPDDFLEPLESPLASSPPPTVLSDGQGPQLSRDTLKTMLRHFWKAGDYDAEACPAGIDLVTGVDHARVHPKFLHSNATSHKWSLGAFAELLDNALDEAANGATFVSVDMVHNPRNNRPMLTIEDNGGGMNPERIRQCMSLGYSAKSKVANMIGQYGNGFKTSTMRLGADVLVFSRNRSKDGSLPTQSIGLLSYTFLMATGQDEIVVPILDYELQPFGLKKIVKGTLDDWNRNLEVLLQWSPYETEQGLLRVLQRVKNQGTIIVVFNLWENEEGELELDFDADPDDIQLKGTNRDEKNMHMASKYPHCKHYFTYKYSLRSYASILYLRLPKTFHIILRGKQVIHHRLVNDLMLVEKVKYKPLKAFVLSHKDALTFVTLGFVKHAKEHIDVQGFNVYHKNRLIIPFWRVWNYPGVKGRGVFGVLEANFVEPAHDKQGFERTMVFARLEARLIEIQKNFWDKNCQEIGYHGKQSKAKKLHSKVESEIVEQSAGTDKTISSDSAQIVKAIEHTAGFKNVGRELGASAIDCPTSFDASGLSLQASLMSESPQHGNEGLISPLSQCNVLESSQCARKNGANTASASVLPRTLTRSELQLQQSHAKFAQHESAHVQHRNRALSSSTTNMSCLTKATVDDGPQSVTTLNFPISEENIDELEGKLDATRQKLRNLQADFGKVCRERDFLKRELKEERRRQCLVEDELQNRLQGLTSKAMELEAANALTQVCQR